MNLDDRGRGDGIMGEATLIDPFLDGDMGFGFQLKVALLRILAVVVLHRPFDVDGVRVVTFDEVAVVAVHRAHEVREG